MYNILDYFKRGSVFANNTLFPSRKKLSVLMLYATNICNSRCKHCLIWAKRPIDHMPKKKIIEIMKSRCITKNTKVGLEGGEFLLHPEAMEILQWFSKNHPNFDLLTNCLKPKKTMEAVKKHPPKRLYISLDGTEETYKYMRGVDGYKKVIETIESCKDFVPISIMFTLSPYNKFSDLEHVVNVAKKYDIDIRTGVYNNIDYFDTVDKAHTIEVDAQNNPEELNFKNNIPSNVKYTSENYDFLILYDEWRKNKLKLPCQSILDSLVIQPDGNVPICQSLELKLGNVYEKSLDEIYNGIATQKIHKEYSANCNKCWINFHRKYDIIFFRTVEKFLPKKVIETFFGKYHWTNNPKTTYKKLINKF